MEIFLTAVFCSFSADSSEQVLATTESDMPADSEPLLVEVSWLQYVESTKENNLNEVIMLC